MDLKMEAVNVDDEQPEIKREVFSDEDDEEFPTHQEITPSLEAGTHHVDGTEIKSECKDVKIENIYDIQFGQNAVLPCVSNSESSRVGKIMDITEIRTGDDEQNENIKTEECDGLEDSRTLPHKFTDHDDDNSVSDCDNDHMQTQMLIAENPHNCDTCDMCFSDEHGLSAHLKTHKGRKSHKCDVCGKFCNTAQVLSVHRRTHTGEKPYKCDVCGKCFSGSCYISRHMRTHTGEKPYKCDVCGKCFNKAGILCNHMKTHTGEKPYICDICGKCFNKADILSNHIRIHTGEKPYKCDVCDRCFNKADVLSNHMRTHTGEKPYKCDICGKCFSRAGSLSRHKKTHTGEKH